MLNARLLQQKKTLKIKNRFAQGLDAIKREIGIETDTEYKNLIQGKLHPSFRKYSLQ